MELDISKLLGDTLTELEQSGDVEKHIKDIFRTAVFKAVDNVLDGYKLRSAIEKQLEEKLPGVVKAIGLDGYMECGTATTNGIASKWSLACATLWENPLKWRI